MCVRLALLGVLSVGAGLGRAAAQPYPAPPGPPGMLTDKPEYCGHLAVEWAEQQRQGPPPPQLARMLAAEGRAMCARGLVRGGIMRLRRALMILRTGDD